MLAHQWTGSKTTPTDIYGPYATKRTLDGALAFFRANVEIRTIDKGLTSKPEELVFGHDHRNYETNMARAKEEAAAGRTENIFRHVAQTHVTPADAGRMAKDAGVKTIVLNHQVRGQAANGFTISSFIDGVRAVFDGQVIVGRTSRSSSRTPTRQVTCLAP